MEYPGLQTSWAGPPPQTQQPSKPPIQTLPTNEVDKVKLLSQIILRESPIQHELPLLPQLIDRQRLLRSLISGPSTATTSSSPLGISLNQQLPLIPPQEALISLPISTSAEYVVIPSTSAPESIISIAQNPSYLKQQSQVLNQPNQISDSSAYLSRPERSESPIDVVQIDQTSSRSSPLDITQSRKRKLSSETTSTCSAADTSPHLFEISEKHFTEVFTKQGVPTSKPGAFDVKNERPNTQLISILNRCVSNMRNLLNQHGVAVRVDDNGMPVDYSSRPVDEIFKRSRKQLEMSRNFQNNKEKDNS